MALPIHAAREERATIGALHGLQRVKEETDQGLAKVTKTYNAQDEITSYKDPRNITTSYVVSGFGDIKREVSPDSGTTDCVPAPIVAHLRAT